MMSTYIDDIRKKMEILNPLHAKKLTKNIQFFDPHYYALANPFFARYIAYLEEQNKSIDYAIDCYLNMIADMNVETFEFVRTGVYSSSTFEEVNQRVYANPDIMEYYMHGLLMSQFLWKHHYQMFDFFITTFPAYAGGIRNYLEIGAGHGLYLSKALDTLKEDSLFTVVDISETSIAFASTFNHDQRVSYHLRNIFDFEEQGTYDFITMGEVLEHVEDPLRLLNKLHDLLSDHGTAFITTPTNAPAIDHIYLFNNVSEIQDLIHQANFEIVTEKYFFAEDVTPEKAERLKITILYGAFIRKQRTSP